MFKGQRPRIKFNLSMPIKLTSAKKKQKETKPSFENEVRALRNQFESSRINRKAVPSRSLQMTDDAMAIKEVFSKIGVDVFLPFLRLKYSELEKMNVQEMVERGLPEHVAIRILCELNGQSSSKSFNRTNSMKNTFCLSRIKNMSRLPTVHEGSGDA